MMMTTQFGPQVSLDVEPNGWAMMQFTSLVEAQMLKSEAKSFRPALLSDGRGTYISVLPETSPTALSIEKMPKRGANEGQFDRCIRFDMNDIVPDGIDWRCIKPHQIINGDRTTITYRHELQVTVEWQGEMPNISAPPVKAVAPAMASKAISLEESYVHDLVAARDRFLHLVEHPPHGLTVIFSGNELDIDIDRVIRERH